MGTKDRRSKFSLEDVEAGFEQSRAREVRRIRKVHPLGLRVVVRIVKDANVTDTGLYRPEGAKESMQESVLAEVIEVASRQKVALLTDEKGREVHSEKMVEIHFRGGLPVAAGDQFGVGRVITPASNP